MTTRFYVNDLSINGGFRNHAEFEAAFNSLLRTRARSPYLRQHLYCSNGLSGRKVYEDVSMVQALNNVEHDARQRFFQWLTRVGPFIEDDRQAEDNDLFWFEDVEVQDMGLGEAARRICAGGASATFSFDQGSEYNFCIASIPVTHGLLDEPIAEINVQNFWEFSTLSEFVAGLEPTVESWGSMIEYCRRRHGNLLIGENCFGILKKIPFSSGICEAVITRIGVLQKIMENRGDDGSFNDEANELVEKHFTGSSAWFSDESSSNKAKFQQEMTFPDPADYRRRITCFWHGKVRQREFRIHFEWPVKPTDELLKIVYIGPKISKD